MTRRREIFPTACVTTLESWLRYLYDQHGEDLPPKQRNLVEWKRQLATNALGIAARNFIPHYDALFVDEAQDLLAEEVALLREWSQVLFFAGDDRQHIYEGADNLSAIRSFVPTANQRILPFHYRLAPEICRAADRILIPLDGNTLESGAHYKGPKPGKITPWKAAPRDVQMTNAASKLKQQLRAFGDLIMQGDRLGIVVPRQDDRDLVLAFLEQDADLAGKAKIIRSRDEGETGYDPSFSPTSPICILTVHGCKGLEFRSVHWLFCDDLGWCLNNEHYYTVVTRAKTQLDLYCDKEMPQVLARSYADTGGNIW